MSNSSSSSATRPAAPVAAINRKGARRADKDRATQLALHRLSVLVLAQELGSISEACSLRSMDRASFYKWKRRFQTQGLEGLKDLPPIPRSHPATTPVPVQERVAALALQHPARGCDFLSGELAREAISLSGVTVQSILNKRGLGSRHERLQALEQRALAQTIELTPKQLQLIEKVNPCFVERHVESHRPGELLCQDIFYVGQVKGMGKVYLHAVVDTYSSYAFGALGTSKQPQLAFSVLLSGAWPFYSRRKLPVRAVLIGNGKEFIGSESHDYEVLLSLYDIELRRASVTSPLTNGFIERFRRTVLAEFFRVKLRTTVYESLEALQGDLNRWLEYYNEERPHLGYRNMGRCPLDAVNDFLMARSANMPSTSPVEQEA
jgi:transposase InsO family protein